VASTSAGALAMTLARSDGISRLVLRVSCDAGHFRRSSFLGMDTDGAGHPPNNTERRGTRRSGASVDVKGELGRLWCRSSSTAENQSHARRRFWSFGSNCITSIKYELFGCQRHQPTVEDVHFVQ
jgi:hypothetical protein